MTITFGEPFRLEPKADGSRLTPDEAIDRAMRAVAAMLPAEYRGIYASAEADS